MDISLLGTAYDVYLLVVLLVIWGYKLLKFLKERKASKKSMAEVDAWISQSRADQEMDRKVRLMWMQEVRADYLIRQLTRD